MIATTKNLTGVGMGYYFLKIKDNSTPGCNTYSYNYTLTSPLTVSATVKDNASCTAANGSITITAFRRIGHVCHFLGMPKLHQHR